MKNSRYYLLAVLILLVIAISLILVNRVGSPAPLAFCTPAAGIITFFALLAERGLNRTADERLRHAIASAIVVQYLVLVGIVAYFINDKLDKLPPIVETMLSSFTAVTSVVAAFYFGASAFVDAKVKSARKEDNSNSSDAEM